MQYTVELGGVPIGTLEITLNPLTGGTLNPVAGYAEHRALVRAATLATSNFGFLGPADDPASAERAASVFDRHRELLDALGLRDPDGLVVPCEFLDLTEDSGDDSRPFVFLSIDESFASVGARVAG